MSVIGWGFDDAGSFVVPYLGFEKSVAVFGPLVFVLVEGVVSARGDLDWSKASGLKDLFNVSRWSADVS